MSLLTKKNTAFFVTLITVVLIVAMVSPTFGAGDNKKPKKKDSVGVIGYDWDKSSIDIIGDCNDDPDLEAVFEIINTGDPGEGDMDGITFYYIYINDILQNTESFQLNGGDSLIVTVDAGCDDSVRLEADQRPGHPGNSHPRLTIEFADCHCSEID